MDLKVIGIGVTEDLKYGSLRVQSEQDVFWLDLFEIHETYVNILKRFLESEIVKGICYEFTKQNCHMVVLDIENPDAREAADIFVKLSLLTINPTFAHPN